MLTSNGASIVSSTSMECLPSRSGTRVNASFSWRGITSESNLSIMLRSAAACFSRLKSRRSSAIPVVRAMWTMTRLPSCSLSDSYPRRKPSSRRSRSFRPGIRCSRRGTGIEIKPFWNRAPIPRTKWREAELIEEYQSLLEDAVRLQLRSDVPLGLFLSSGIDSGVLLALMSKYSSGPVQAFTIGFEQGEKTNEVEDAKEIARMFGAEHSFMIVSAQDYMKYYDRYMWDLEEPVGNETAAAFYFVAKITRERVKVALTGQGRGRAMGGL